MPDWKQVREQFPALNRWTFLNTATFGQLPRRAVEAVHRHFEHRDETACADFLDWFDDADEIRALAARLVNASVSDIALIPNASTALGLLMGGIDWKPGDRIVTLETEFPNNLYFPSMLRDRGVEFVEVPWGDFYNQVTPRTRLVLMSALNYSTGFRPPLVEVGRFLRERGVLFYLDGTQGAGAVRIDAAAVQPDLLAVHGYKWLISPTGAGFAYIGPRVREWLQPAVIGWRSDRRWREVNALHHGAPEFVDAAERYEGAMLNFPSLYAMGESLKLILDLGVETIESRVLELASACERVVTAAGGAVEHSGSPILAARFEGRDAGELARHLREKRILVSARHGRLRISVHLYNDETDLDRLAEGLRRGEPAGPDGTSRS